MAYHFDVIGRYCMIVQKRLTHRTPLGYSRLTCLSHETSINSYFMSRGVDTSARTVNGGDAPLYALTCPAPIGRVPGA